MYELKFSEPFYDDVESAVSYVEKTFKEPVPAYRISVEVQEAYKKIKEFPLIYPLVPDKYLASLGYRFKMVRKFMLFYIVEDNVIEIVRFLHGKRNWKNILKEEK